MTQRSALPYPPDVVAHIETLQREKHVLLERAKKKQYNERNHIMRRVIAIEDELARYFTPNL
ncbi:MAG: hypothetical protein M0Z66_02630 [Thermaerobacter sp.]|nr:hypothetical protein [Thermaerobacter sp.]